MFRLPPYFHPEKPASIMSTKLPRRIRRGLKPTIEPMEARLVLSTFAVPAASGTYTIPANPLGDNEYTIQGNWNPSYAYTFTLSLPARSTVTLTNQSTPADRGFYIDGVSAPDGSDPLPYAVLESAGVSASFDTTVAGSYSIATDPGGWLDGPFTLVVTVPAVAPVVTFASPASAFPINTQLMSKVPFHVAVSPSSPAPSLYGIQVAGVGIAPQGWTDVSTSSSPDFEVTERLAGKFAIRAFAVIDGVRCYSDQSSSETVHFPKIGDIAQSPTVIDATREAWQDTLKYFATKHHKRREEGFWITLDTETGTYGHSPIGYGPVLNGNSTKGGEIDLFSSKPDDVYNPASLSAIYVVASFHTHTPATYVPRKGTNSRIAGPSPQDDANSDSIGIPGLVYDYDGASGKVRPGTPMKAKAQLYFTPNDSLFGFGTTRRNLPGPSGGRQ